VTRATIQRLLYGWGIAVAIASVLGRPAAVKSTKSTPGISPESASWENYKVGVDLFKTLADIRFKLLAFVPTISGAAIVLLSKDFATTNENAALGLIAGLLGLVVTLGVVFYDQRNSQISNATFFRLQWLETQLGMGGRGQFTTRPGRDLRLLELWTIWHDRGLALIYGSALGAWFFPIVQSVLLLFRIDQIWGMTRNGASAVSAALFALFFIVEMHRLDRQASAGRPILS
jgi:hypothetical protein